MAGGVRGTSISVGTNDGVFLGGIGVGPLPRASAGLIRFAHFANLASVRDNGDTADIPVISAQFQNIIGWGVGDFVTFGGVARTAVIGTDGYLLPNFNGYNALTAVHLGGGLASSSFVWTDLTVNDAAIFTSLAFGPIVSRAQSGVIRMQNDSAIVARNAANSADIQIARVTNAVIVGDSTLPTRIQAGASAMLFNVNTLDLWQMDATAFSPVTDSARDIGIATNRIRNIFLTGQIKQSGVNGAAAALAVFNNAPTANVVQYIPLTFNGLAGWVPWIPA